MSEIARGLAGVVLTETILSRVDGEAGELIIGGFALEDLAPFASYEEVLFLIWNDRLPTQSELDSLIQELASKRQLEEVTLTVLKEAAKHRLPTMDALRMGVDTLSINDPQPRDKSRDANCERAKSIIASAPTIVASYKRFLTGGEPIEPSAELGHAANFLYMLNGKVPHSDAV